MKKLFKPASLLFNLLVLLAFFVLGLLFAGWIDAGKGQMLAAGAIVLGYGVLFGGIAFIASFFLTHHARHRTIVIGNIVLAVFLLVSFGYFRYRFKQRQQNRKPNYQEQPKTPTAPVDNGKLIAMNKIDNHVISQTTTKMGLGFFAPNFYDHSTVFFYGNPNLEKSVMEHSPTDSVVFKRIEHRGFDIVQAPPWLVPEHLKLDYDLLYFQIRSLGKDFAEVVVNNQTGRTAYVNNHRGNIILWPEFLLGVHSVEFPSESNQKVKERPFVASSDINMSFSFMHPILVRDDWMLVELWNDNFNKVGEGWIRWREEGRLLVIYNLLS
ncbi:hypothetical protein [Allomuricauda sp. d1]|uniref:hypothetical protein n=1 Tax=Allomuricauda sp. d1 TaxID=3136725 RepID=UPI0031D431A3